MRAIEQVEDEKVRGVLQRLCILFCLKKIEDNLSSFLAGGMMDGKQAKMVEKLVIESCQSLRKDAVPLVDSFNIPDFVLNSPLGYRDGDVYSKYLEKVCSLPNVFSGAPYWKEHIFPLVGNTEIK